MYRKTVTYTDYNGDERTETFWFHLSKAEIAEMELSTTGGLKSKIEKIISTKDTPGLVKIFKELLLMSYGEKSDDGRRFVKNKELRDAFSQTEAYSEIFMELATDDKAAAEFVNNILPKDVAEQVKKQAPEIVERINN